MTTADKLNLEKLDAPLAEINGLTDKMLTDTVDAVLQAWYDNQVLVFRDQELTCSSLSILQHSWANR